MAFTPTSKLEVRGVGLIDNLSTSMNRGQLIGRVGVKRTNIRFDATTGKIDRSYVSSSTVYPFNAIVTEVGRSTLDLTQPMEVEGIGLLSNISDSWSRTGYKLADTPKGSIRFNSATGLADKGYGAPASNMAGDVFVTNVAATGTRVTDIGAYAPRDLATACGARVISMKANTGSNSSKGSYNVTFDRNPKNLGSRSWNYEADGSWQGDANYSPPIGYAPQSFGELAAAAFAPTPPQPAAAPFYMVYGEGQSAPTYKHLTEAQALTEAKRLSDRTPGTKFFVMRPVRVAVKAKPLPVPANPVVVSAV